MVEDYSEFLETTDVDWFAYLEDSGASSAEEWDIEHLLVEAQKQERQRLEAELATIDDELGRRDELHYELVRELERELERYDDQLQQLVRQFGSKERKVEQKVRIRELSEELRQERRQHWRDRQQLLTERREVRGELASLEDDLLTRFL